MEERFVSYIRVSTQQQGASGLGLEAQQEAVRRYVGNNPIIEEFREIESGKRDGNRPQLLAALDLCKRKGAKLVVGKLDRLSRNLAFIANLMDAGVQFVCCDMPEANELTIHIMAVMAQHERKAISQRTKDALAACKARGVALGNKNWVPALEAANRARNPNPPPPRVVAMMQRMRSEGKTLRAIAAELNELGLRTPPRPSRPQGSIWHACTVRTVLLTAPKLAVAA